MQLNRGAPADVCPYAKIAKRYDAADIDTFWHEHGAFVPVPEQTSLQHDLGYAGTTPAAAWPTECPVQTLRHKLRQDDCSQMRFAAAHVDSPCTSRVYDCDLFPARAPAMRPFVKGDCPALPGFESAGKISLEVAHCSWVASDLRIAAFIPSFYL